MDTDAEVVCAVLDVVCVTVDEVSLLMSHIIFPGPGVHAEYESPVLHASPVH